MNYDLVYIHAKRITTHIRLWAGIQCRFRIAFRNFWISLSGVPFVSSTSSNQNSSKVDGQFMCSEPTFLYRPDYKCFKFIAANGVMKEAKVETRCHVSDPERKEGNDGSEEYKLPELVVFLNDVCFEKKPTVQSRGKCLVENCELDHKTISSIIESDNAVTEPRCLKDTRTTNEDDNGRIKETNLIEIGEVPNADLAISMVTKNDDMSELCNDVIVLEEAAETIRKSDESSYTDTATSGAEELLLSPVSHQPDHDPAEALKLIRDGLTESCGLAESSTQAHQSFSEESSLFVAGHLPGHGPAGPSFRCASHRSNSSTTSSRSFAFPVIASEWHGSPERLARTEKRKPRKQERKCARFFCCKFF